MKILAMIDSFKGTITSKELGILTKEVLNRYNIECDYFATSDGGDGFLDSLLTEDGFEVKKVQASDPMFRKIECEYLINNNVAYIEMAKISGINLLTKEELDPFTRSTYGLGEVILDAINNGYKRIVLGIGGSATNDAGMGLLEALGVKFYSSDKLINNIKNEDFSLVTSIDRKLFNDRIKDTQFIVISDVQNPLLGPTGATYTFSKQKGAKEEDFVKLEENIKYISDFGKNSIDKPGSGAAGGVGYALHEYFNAKFIPGIDYLLDRVSFKEIIKTYDYIITGEGKVDSQSLLGKVVFKIASNANKQNVIVVCAINEVKDIDNANIVDIYSIVNSDVSINDSLNNPTYYYKKMIERLAKDLKEKMI